MFPRQRRLGTRNLARVELFLTQNWKKAPAGWRQLLTQQLPERPGLSAGPVAVCHRQGVYRWGVAENRRAGLVFEQPKAMALRLLCGKRCSSERNGRQVCTCGVRSAASSYVTKQVMAKRGSNEPWLLKVGYTQK